MPYIDCKLTKKLTEEQKETLKSELGKAISAMHKPESYLMVGILDGYDLWFGGKKLDNGAFVDIKAFGAVNSSDCEKMTASVCNLLNKVAGTDGSAVYVTYQGVKDWGWNGGNF